MKIVEVARRRRSLYALTLDVGEPVTVDVRTWDESPYRQGGEITPEQLDALLARSRYNRAHDRALYLLGLRDYAARELEQKLLREAQPDEAAQVVERLQELGLVDDERYAAHTARSLSEYKGYPRRRVEQELCRRGVSAEIAREAVARLDAEDFQQALALIEKKYYNKMKTLEGRRQVAGALGRRGFSYGAIRHAMERYDETQDLHNEEFEEPWQ